MHYIFVFFVEYSSLLISQAVVLPYYYDALSSEYISSYYKLSYNVFTLTLLFTLTLSNLLS
jgi:hypothetical protein